MEGKTVLIVGGGLAGIEAALELADAGNRVYLVEKAPGLGGERILPDGDFNAQDPFTTPSLEEIRRHPNIQVITHADLKEIKGTNGQFRVKLRKKATRIMADKCDDCKACIRVCPINLWDDYNRRLSWRTAIDYFNPALGDYCVIKETPICQETCPVHLDIRGYIGLIAEGKYGEAFSLIRERLPFPAVIGRICTHPCEEVCNRGKVDQPLSIKFLKRFVADYEIQTSSRPRQEGAILGSRPERVAVVGAGPAGLTAAHDLAWMGYNVTVFEALPVAGGMLAVGIPQYRLPRDVLNREIGFVQDLGVEIKTNTPIGKDLTLDDLFAQGYKAVFIAVGAHQSMRLNIPGEEAEGVVHGVDFLRDLNLGREVWVGDRVGIIGGGNVAMDAARSALRLGAKEVLILYRRSRQEMPASTEEIEAAEHEGVKIEYLVAPVEVLTNQGKVVGLRCVRMRLGEPDTSGRRRPIPIEGSEFNVELDMIIPAIGQAADLSFIPEDSGIEVRRGRIVVSPDTLATTRPGVFAGGDVVTGPWIAIEAIAAGKKAALSIDAYLRGG